MRIMNLSSANASHRFNLPDVAEMPSTRKLQLPILRGAEAGRKPLPLAE
jgi:hypothetical protein